MLNAESLAGPPGGILPGDSLILVRLDAQGQAVPYRLPSSLLASSGAAGSSLLIPDATYTASGPIDPAGKFVVVSASSLAVMTLGAGADGHTLVLKRLGSAMTLALHLDGADVTLPLNGSFGGLTVTWNAGLGTWLLMALLDPVPSIANLTDTALDGGLVFPLYDPAARLYKRASIAAMVAFDGGKVIQPLHAYGHVPNPVPTAKLDLLRVGALQQFGEIYDATVWANPGATILVDDGIYYHPTHHAVPNLTIRSVSGNPYRCYMDGEGGNGGGKRLAYGKAMLHCGDITTVIGMGFRRCGSILSALNQYSNESGIYAEDWPTLGDLTLTRCAFDDNGDGVFIPHGPNREPSANIRYVETECIFAGLVSNSHSNPLDSGPSHDRYITPVHCSITGSYMYGNDNGHSIKCGAPVTVVADCPWIASWGGRAVETPYGGTATITNCTLISRGDLLPNGAPATGNFIGIGDEVTTNAGNQHDYDTCIFYSGRGGDQGGIILMPNGGTMNVTNSTIHYFGTGFLSLVGSGVINGLAMGGPPAGDPSRVAEPVRPPIPSWAFV